MNYLKYPFFLNLIFIFVLTFTLSSCKKIKPKPIQDKIPVEQETDYKDDSSEPETPKVAAALKYQYHWLDSKDIPSVAIVIDDFGQISGDLLKGFLELDDNVTFAVLPDLPNSSKTAQLANVYGHEVILHIPMQAQDTKQNPGKSYIKVNQAKDDIKDIINDFLDQMPQAIGANNHMGSGTTADYYTILNVMEVLKKKGLFFLDSRTSAESKVANAAKELNVDYSARDIFLDVPDVSSSTINQKLKDLEKYRGRAEPVIIISHCHNQAKLTAMRSFISHLKGMGINLIPLSDAVRKFQTPV